MAPITFSLLQTENTKPRGVEQGKKEILLTSNSKQIYRFLLSV